MSFRDLDPETVLVDVFDRNHSQHEEEEKKKAKLRSDAEKEKDKWELLTEMGIISVVEEDCDHLFKVLVVGDSAVGKTCITRRYTESTFSPHYLFTIGVDFKTKAIEVDNTKCVLQIWDTAGQERFRTITSSYYRGAVGIVIVYDVSDATSFENVPQWLEEIDRNADQGVKPVRVLVGNKSDLNQNRQVDYKVAKAFASKNGMPFYEASAKSGEGVEKAFLVLASLMVRQKQKQADSVESAQLADEVDVGGETWVVVTSNLLQIGEVPNTKPRSKLSQRIRTKKAKCCGAR